MKNLRFWQKTYLLTLGLFLLALFGGIAFIGWQTQQQSVNSATESLKQEQQFIAQNLSQDASAIEDNVHLRVSSLVRSYGEYYVQQGLYIQVKSAEDKLFSNIPEQGDAWIGFSTETGRQSWGQLSFGDTRYLVVESRLTGSLEGYHLVCARSMSAIQRAWDQMTATLIIGSVAVSAVLALGLFFILRRLSRPLEKLAGTADAFAAGDFEVRAVEKGNDEIEMLARSFNAMANTALDSIEEISEIAEANERMAANLSHEVRTPLTSIKGYAEYLRLSNASEEERDSALEYIIKESDRLHAVAERMLELFSLQHEEIPFFSLNLAQVVEQSLRSVWPKAQTAQVEMRVASLPLATIKGDAVLLESLIVNLLDNAIKACSTGGCVVVGLRVTERLVVVEITDNGYGLSKQELAALGEPFYRADKARSRKQGGAGLGVALSFHIAHLHGARLRYSSRSGQGTKVQVEFTLNTADPILPSLVQITQEQGEFTTS